MAKHTPTHTQPLQEILWPSGHGAGFDATGHRVELHMFTPKDTSRWNCSWRHWPFDWESLKCD